MTSSDSTEKLAGADLGRRGVSFAAGTDTIAGDQSDHLRSRTATAALILCACFAVVFVNQIIVGDNVWRLQAVGLLVVLGGAAFVLSSDFALSTAKLRLIEFSVIGCTAVWLAGRHLNIMANLVEAEDRAGLLTRANGAVIGFFTIIVIYGLVIPNTWRRTAAVVSALVLFPLVEPFLLGKFFPKISELAPEVLAPELLARNGVFLVVGSIVAVYGTHSLNALRREVHEAKKIGQYQLEKRIGEGGMGEVWKARHGFLARSAAIKLIKIEALSGGGMEDAGTATRRFEREAQVTASLDCPHTIGVFDYGTTSQGSLYYAMEFLDGLDLESLVKDHGPISAGRTVSIWMQVCRSLAEAHARDLIHRDIKPANIYLCRYGLEFDFVKVLDFGLVKSTESGDVDANLTQQGVVGTPAFITPEAMLGKQVEGRSDVYATACVAYWLLTGEFVFRGTAMEMATGHARVEPAQPSDRTPNQIPKALGNIVMTCLAKKPEDRPTALELLRQLEDTGLANEWTTEASERWWKIHMS